MNENVKNIKTLALVFIDMKYGGEVPTLEQLIKTAKKTREDLKEECPISDEEFDQLVNSLRETVEVSIGDPHSLRMPDPNHQSWYPTHKNDGFYWNRYRTYLQTKKHWSSDVIKKLNETTDYIMDELGDPTNPKKDFARRGLLLGDVQSGKTATYTAICNKAADAGYRVIIVLSGMMENLRFQTQERLDAEFAGRESKYALDTKADSKIKNKSLGVGKIPPLNRDKRISCFTSVSTDFNKRVLKTNDLTLRNLTGTALFVVKKNKSILNHLHKWLVDNNADENNKIDLPLLLIDDEADNASVNTQTPDHDPTAINIAIRSILNSFYQSSYLGITATPFANIFIDPETKDGGPADLFPRDFITVLPTPSNYIGADRIFGNGDEEDGNIRNNTEYFSTLIPISKEEMGNYFAFGHRKELAFGLADFPASLKEALSYFILATAIRNLRGDENEHCSMMINVSRFTEVQNKLAKLIKDWLSDVKSDIEEYCMLDPSESLKIKYIRYLKDVWDKYELEKKAECDWQSLQQELLFDAVKRIEVQAVNQSTGAASLDYYNYKNIGKRVIAVGGNSLSRGLTIEGLCVSYFYRNTMMYDTLLQMGRWFGYRPNYDDIFKIWMAKDSVDWYGYICDATNDLKSQLVEMERLKKTPKEFGLRVRQDPNSLIVTARNKMRTGTKITVPVTLSSRLIETPRLKNDLSILENNQRICKNLIAELDSIPGVSRTEQKEKPSAVIWHNVPRKYVIKLVNAFEAHPWHLNYQSKALCEYISAYSNLEMWDVAIPNGSIDEKYTFNCFSDEIHIKPEDRYITEDSKMLRVSGTHVKVGSGNSTRIGLSQSQIEEIDEKALDGKKTDRTYLIQERRPILMIHVLKTKPEKDGPPLIQCPPYLFALALGFPSTGEKEQTVNYIVNIQDLSNWIDYSEDDEYDDDI